MIERSQSISTKDGQMPTFVAHGDHPKAVVVMLMDGRGVRPAKRDLARRLAGDGYYAMLPNLFYRHAGQGKIEDVTDMAWMTTLNTSITPERAVADIEACLAAAAADPQGPPKGRQAGLIGFCMGGRLSVVAAQALGRRIGAVASLHPGYMATRAETSPHRHLDKITAEIYFGLPEHDDHLSPGAVARLREALDANRVDYKMEVLDGASHGFSVPGSDVYHPKHAEHAWARAVELFDRRLAAPAPAGA